MASLFKVTHHTVLHNTGALFIMAIVIIKEYKTFVLYPIEY